jgi:hypothetical protein
MGKLMAVFKRWGSWSNKKGQGAATGRSLIHHINAALSRKGREMAPKKKQFCKWGHEFTPENTHVYRGTRRCKKCIAIREARRVRKGRKWKKITVAKKFHIQGGIRLLCPDCETTWDTLQCPCECPTCGAMVTVRVISRPK